MWLSRWRARQARRSGRRIGRWRPAGRRAPEGPVDRDRNRIEVRFSGAKDAVGRLYALAQALVNDYERFEELVDGGREVVGGGEGSE